MGSMESINFQGAVLKPIIFWVNSTEIWKLILVPQKVWNQSVEIPNGVNTE